METTSGEEGDIVETVILTELPLTYFERLLMGSSEPMANGLMLTMDQAIEENFPDSLNEVAPMTSSSLDEINQARRAEKPIPTDSIGPLMFTALPEDRSFQIYPSDLEPGIVRAEFGVVETFIGKDGASRKREVTDPGIIRGISPDKLGDHFKLESVPGNDSRRYIVPVKRS